MRNFAPAVLLRHVSRTYGNGLLEVNALWEVSLDVAQGESVAVTGPSGSGKTTLLHLVAGLDRMTSGEILVFGERLNDRSDAELTAMRAARIGLVFQEPHLLAGLTALENVMVAGLPWRSRSVLEAEAREVLAAVGLSRRMEFPPGRLSAGERQRVAIARALTGKRELLLADEPTGNLDASTTDEIVELLTRLGIDNGLTKIVATHDVAVAAAADRVVRLSGGRIADEQTLDGSASLEVHEVGDR